MNIRQAKKYIENTVKLYLKKDEFGEYRIPTVRQRPIFLLGARVSARRPLWSRLPRRWALPWYPIP